MDKTEKEKPVKYPATTEVPEWLTRWIPTAKHPEDSENICMGCRGSMERFIPRTGYKDFLEYYKRVKLSTYEFYGGLGHSACFFISDDLACPICNMIRFSRENNGFSPNGMLSTYWDLIDLRQSPDDGHIMTLKCQVVNEYNANQYRMIFCHGATLKARSERTTTVAHESVNFELLKAKVDHCHKTHGTHCNNREESFLPSLHVINCRTRQIQPAKPGEEYVALSYVWGHTSPSATTSCSGEILQRLPVEPGQTIEDAVQVTLEMGYSYLWVDKYCIDQRETEGKQDQIQRMDSIYRNSAVTIVAAAGDDVNHGLPGVSARRPRVARTHWRFGHFVVSKFTEHNYPQLALLLTSRWNTRGWTYQEGLLSRRCLVFTDEQVSFTCRATTVDCGSEGVLDVARDSDCKLDADNYPFDETICTGTGTFPEGVQVRLQEYSKRQLTCPDVDALRAVSGILKAFEKMDTPVHNLWGIPIFPPGSAGSGRHRESCPSTSEAVGRARASLAEEFLRCLRWKMKPVCRRGNFPSWSWAGWTGKIRGGLDVVRNRHLQDSEPAGVSVELKDGTIVPWAELERRAFFTDAPEKLSRFLWLDTWILPIRLWCSYNHPGEHIFARIDGDTALPTRTAVSQFPSSFYELVRSAGAEGMASTGVVVESLRHTSDDALVVEYVDGVAERRGLFRARNLLKFVTPRVSSFPQAQSSIGLEYKPKWPSQPRYLFGAQRLEDLPTGILTRGSIRLG